MTDVEQAVAPAAQDTDTPAVDRRERAKALLAKLSESYPKAFPPPGSRTAEPLKVGIHKDLAAVIAEWGYSGADLRLALTLHTRQLRYQIGIVKASQRVDLNGEAAGEVTDENRSVAEAKIAEIQAKREARRPKPAPGTDEARTRESRGPRRPRPAGAERGKPRTHASGKPRPEGKRGPRNGDSRRAAPATPAPAEQQTPPPSRPRRKDGKATDEALAALAAKFNIRD